MAIYLPYIYLPYTIRKLSHPAFVAAASPYHLLHTLWSTSHSISAALVLIFSIPVALPLVYFPYCLFLAWARRADILEYLRFFAPGPGRRISDHADMLLWHPLQRYRFIRHAHSLSPNHGPCSMPPEIFGLILEFVDDTSTLRAASLVCSCWTSESRRHIFRSVSASAQSAYTLMELLRAPHQTVTSHIREVLLKDSMGWPTSGPIITHMMNSDVVPERLQLELYYPLPNVQASSTFCQLTTLQLELHGDAFEHKLSRLASFLSAFQRLESLDINSHILLDANPGMEAGKCHPYHLSHSLRNLSIRCHPYFDSSLADLILGQGPKLESLGLHAPSNGYGPNLAVLARYFRDHGNSIQHLDLTLADRLSDADRINGLCPFNPLEVMIPSTELAPASSHLPRLSSLRIGLSRNCQGPWDNHGGPGVILAEWIRRTVELSKPLCHVRFDKFQLGNDDFMVHFQKSFENFRGITRYILHSRV